MCLGKVSKANIECVHLLLFSQLVVVTAEEILHSFV